MAHRKLSNGTPMEQRHRIGNAEVDMLAKSAACDDRRPISILKRITAKGDKVIAIAMWIGRCTSMANHFPDSRNDPNARPQFLRDSEGMAANRLPKAKRGTKRKAIVVLPHLYDLSSCPRWQRLRQRILDKAAGLH